MQDRHLSTSDLAATESSEETRERPTPASDAPLTREAGSIGGDDLDDTDDTVGGGVGGATSGAAASTREPLLPYEESEGFTDRWQEIQTAFVDEPRRSVQQADALVADLMQRLAAGFAEERQRLEAQWDRGDDVSTEDLRVALTRYRSFFDRLLAA